MSASLGRVTARLAEPSEPVTTGLIDLINRNINPPTPIGPEDVYIRAMFIVSDEVNSFGGRFPIEEHERLAELLIDSPVMVGHRKDKLPIARNFHAVTVERDGRPWVKSYFYWLKSAEGADNLRENIDGGIYKECSIGFTFLFPECSICGKDIRTCDHEPLGSYEVDGQTVSCHFNYRQIERVLETSLVYRGAVSDTSVSKELHIGSKSRPLHQAARLDEPATLNDLTQLDNECGYLVTPYYDGMMVQIEQTDEGATLCSMEGQPLPDEVRGRFDLTQLTFNDELFALLVPYRGKERLDQVHLARLLEGRKGMVSRLELKLIPTEGLELATSATEGAPDCIRMLRHEVVPCDRIDEASHQLMTRDGVRLWALSELPPKSVGFHYRPDRGCLSTDGYRVYAPPSSNGESVAGDAGVLMFSTDNEQCTFVLRQFSPSRLEHGARFVADKLSNDVSAQPPAETAQSGRLLSVSRRNGGYLLRLTGALEGKYALRRIRLEGKERFLFYRRSVQS